MSSVADILSELSLPRRCITCNDDHPQLSPAQWETVLPPSPRNLAMCHNCADKEEGDCIAMLSEKRQQLDEQAFQQFYHETMNDRFLKFTEALVKEWELKRVKLFALVEECPCKKAA
jgi:hypothetical protein